MIVTSLKTYEVEGVLTSSFDSTEATVTSAPALQE